MDNRDDEKKHPIATSLGIFLALIGGEAGAALAVIGGLWTALLAVWKTERMSPSDSWKFYLIGGSLFIAVGIVCRIRARRD